MDEYNNVDSGIIEIFKFLSSDSCKLASYAIREGYAYFTDYAMNEVDNEKYKSIMWAYYIVNCSDLDFPLHSSWLDSDEKTINGKLCEIPLTSFAALLGKREALEMLMSLGVSQVQLKPVDVEIINALKTAFGKQYKKHNNHVEYLNLLKEYTLKDVRFADELNLVGSRHM